MSASGVDVLDVPIYRDPDRPVDERVADLLGRMTLEEKAAQTAAPFALMNDVHAPPPGGWGAAAGALSSLGLPPRDVAAAANELQCKHVEETRLGIPVLLAEECLIGLKVRNATVFPDAIAQAATWDPELVEEMAAVIGRQMAAIGVRQALSPLADVARDPRWGRLEETYGEDPYLAGSMAAAFVRGLQDAVPDAPAVATLKHFIAYGASDGGRNCEPVHVGERALREIYGLPFEMAIRLGGAGGVMPSYNAIDGVPVQASRELLTGLLREELGFDGLVIADLASVEQLYSRHGVAEDREDAVALSFAAGLDLELYDSPSTAAIVQAVRNGRLDERDLDRAVSSVLRTKLRLGLFERPYVDMAGVSETLDPPEARALARRIAERSIVLLRNEPVDGTPLLPLDRGIRSIAVIGPNADRAMGYLGDYSYHVQESMAQLYRTYMNPERRADAAAGPSQEAPASGTYTTSADMAELRVDSVPVVTVLEGIRRRAGADIDVAHEKGCPVQDVDRSGIEPAVRAARAADVAVVVVGDQSGVGAMATVGEGIDSTQCALPGVQRELVEAVVDTGTPTVVVLSHGRPFVLGWMVERVPTIVSALFAGEEAGNAIASVLFGDTDPGGRTPVGYPSSAGSAPVTYARATVPAHTYFDGTARATFPFGHGLSYTSFTYEDLEIDAPEVPTDGVVRVSCTVTNAGDRDGDEVVQLYARDVVARTVRPERELKGFVRLGLAAGEAKRVTFELSADRFALWDPVEGWVVEPGKIELHVGASSEDVRLSGDVVLTGAVHEAGSDRVLVTPVGVRPV